jgi:hypothetical protein
MNLRQLLADAQEKKVDRERELIQENEELRRKLQEMQMRLNEMVGFVKREEARYTKRY